MIKIKEKRWKKAVVTPPRLPTKCVGFDAGDAKAQD